ncbi:B3 domain-containing protein [Hordeum vulgare]|nr:B3 domain-containing protein [Hordeum vulgare]
MVKRTTVIQKDYALEHFPREYTIVILQLPRKDKDWKCTFRIRPSGVCAAGRCNLYLGNFARDNHVRAGENRATDEVMELDDLQTLSKDYVLSRKCEITVASVFYFSNIVIYLANIL